MANQAKSGIKVFDTAAGSAQSGVKGIYQIQWIDDAGDVADGDDLSITIDGATIAVKQNIGSDVGQQNLVIWQLGPFSPPKKVNGYVINVIDHGIVVVVEG